MRRVEKKIRVLVVDDSPLARRAIIDALATDPWIEVVGVAADPYFARERILELEPDVITLDMEMPRMDGLTFLRILQEHHPVPVVVVSSLTTAGSELALQALEAGAIEVLAKPDGSRSIGQISRELTHGVRAAAQSRSLATRNQARTGAKASASPPSARAGSTSQCQMILIGASTGGVEALRHLLPQLPADTPPILVVQHIPASFSGIMARHLDALCPYSVREAEDGDELQRGLCLVAPGNFHLSVRPSGRGYSVRLGKTPPVHYCRPSVDVLFRSAAEIAGPHCVAVLLTGMGSDGARGMQLLRASGARTLAEAEESCVVFGMPQAAINLGAAEQIVPLPQMADAIIRAASQQGTK